MLERILIPYDGSATAESVFALARKLGAGHELVVMRAVPTLRDFKDEADASVEKAVKVLAAAGFQARGVVREGAPADTILAAAHDLHATAILLCTHGRGGLARFALGSVAEKVVRTSPLPVLLVRAFEAAPKDWVFKRILVPMDGSETSLGIIAYATALAREFKSEVIVLHVTEPGYRSPAGAFSGQVFDRPDARPKLPANPSVEEMLRFAADRFAEADLKTTLLHVVGDPASTILDYAREHFCDVIAMATHGRSGISRWVLGSVAEKVIRHATMPMLVVRPWRTE
jgi:nucleotide-binding universal stress UspA family protein